MILIIIEKQVCLMLQCGLFLQVPFIHLLAAELCLAVMMAVQLPHLPCPSMVDKRE